MKSYAALVALALASCSTVRLTPTAAEYVRKGQTALEVAEARREAQREFDRAKLQASAVLEDLVETSPGIRDAFTDESLSAPTPLAALQRSRSAGLEEELSLGESVLRTVDLLEARRDVEGDLEGVDQRDLDALRANGALMLAFERDKRLVERDLEQLARIESGQYEYFVEGSLYFSIEPLIAIQSDLETTAIPSLGINFRPFPPGHVLSAWALQGVLGGALNPSNSGEDVGGALGFGLSHPIAGKGAISFGTIYWDAGDDSEAAPYVSVTLGDFAQTTR